MSLGKAILDAAITGNEHAVAAWLDKGGSVDAGCADHGGTTVLIAAANEGDEAMVRMLLQRGASVNLQNSIGVTALMGAAFNGHTTIAQVLLDAKADASLQAMGGGTALMAAEHQKQGGGRCPIDIETIRTKLVPWSVRKRMFVRAIR